MTRLGPVSAVIKRKLALITLVSTILAACGTNDGSSSGPTTRPSAKHATVALTTHHGPRFVSEADAELSETKTIQGDISGENRELGSSVFTSFYVYTPPDVPGLPNFFFVVDEAAWNGLSDSTRQGIVDKGGWAFNETQNTWRYFHDGKICLPDPDDYLTLHVVNEQHQDVGLDYTIFVSGSDPNCRK